MGQAEEYQAELDELVELGQAMFIDLQGISKAIKGKLAKLSPATFRLAYQGWYTKSHAVVRQLAPERIDEFESLYLPDPRRKEITASNYRVQDWLSGISVTKYGGEELFSSRSSALSAYSIQFEILRAAGSQLGSRLFDIRALLQAELFDSELDAARGLLKSGFRRGAGAVAGVVLEKHLAEVCEHHAIRIRKKNPGIGDFNDILKTSDVVDVPGWRFIQRLGDLRNLCDHNKDRDPTADEVGELIDGVAKISKTLF